MKKEKWSALVSGSLLCLGFACDSDEPPAGRQCPAVVSCSDSDSRRPELDPACNPMLSQYREENWRLPQGQLSAPQPTQVGPSIVVTSYRFGPDRAGDSRFTAWLEADQDLLIEFALGVGADRQIPGPVAVVVLIDGQSVPTSLSGAEAKAANTFELDANGNGTGTLSVPSTALADGASSGSLLFSNSGGAPLSAGSFTVLHGSARFAPRAEPVAMPVMSVPQGLGAIVRRRGEWRSLFATPPGDDGTLPLSFVVTPTYSGECLSLVHRGLVVGLLDHTPVGLGELGPRPAFELKEATAVEFELELVDLPMDGNSHILEFWWLDGDGAYAEAPAGQLSPWYDSPVPLGHVVWGA